MSSRAAKEARRAAQEQLKAARLSGKRNYQLKEQDDVYDEVDEEVYRSVVRGRLAEDEFIEEDQGVSGYADNGMDDWDRENRSESEDDDDEEDAKKKERKQKREEQKKKLNAAAAKRKAKQPVIAEGANPYINPNKKAGLPLPEQEDDFMSSLLGDLDGQASVAPSKKSETPRPKAVPTRLAKTSLSGFKRKAPEDSDSSSFRSSTAFASSSDTAASDPVEDPSFGLVGPSSDGYENGLGKKARFDSSVDGVNGMGDISFDDGNLEGEAKPSNNEDVKMEEQDDDDDLFVKPAAPVVKPKGGAQRRQLVNASAAKPKIPKPEPDLPSPATSSSSSVDHKPKPKGLDWRTATSNLANIASSASSSSIDSLNMDEQADFNAQHQTVVGKNASKALATVTNALEPDGSLQFWWFDYDEPAHQPGTVRLIGKVRAKGETVKVIADGEKVVPKYVSAVLTVKGIKRKLYVLPKTKAEYYGGEGSDAGNDSDDEEEDLPADEVGADFIDDAKKHGATGLVAGEEYVKRRYVFGIKGIPRKETNWLEVSCDFPTTKGGKSSKADIPIESSGELYSHVFGTTATPFERFVVDRKIMGPCWLNVTAPKINKGEAISWTKLEVDADQLNVSAFSSSDASAPKDQPRLTVLSLSTRTVVHLKENKREIVCAAGRIWNNIDIDDPIPIERQGSSSHIFVRNLFTDFPKDFDRTAREATRNGISIFKDERPMLLQLLRYIGNNDPDVIVGQDFSQLDLDVILTRLRDLKIDNWSQIGRLRVPGDKWPVLRSGRNTGLLSGRLNLDLSSDGTKSLIESTTWSLTEMCTTHLNIAREDIDPEDTAKFFDNVHSTAKALTHFVKLCEADCFFQMAIACKVQALPLTRQLTNLAGNSWNRTLAGNRAERNEFILLHRFKETGFIVPDKVSSWEKKEQIKKAENAKKSKKQAETGEDAPKVEIKKEKFKGGLVFDPDKGLWDRYILVMDYNSLYPSIIQEFDIDFATIDWTADDAEDLEKMPERGPCEGEPQGVLPQLIASLVARRKIVKGLMKDKKATAAKLLQYDITQKALKLTANSMYGCLGYEGSRFYARPLAALTTFKGREILTRTKADAESMSLNVIYGDTDSVMINTNQDKYEEALKIGVEFKKLINEKYKKLEIDTDGVFSRMLLLNKKKYAARKVDDDGKGGPGAASTEIKGLDMKRREFSQLSKNASKKTLDFILESDEATEVVVEQIHNYLQDLGESIRIGKVPLDDFIIFKRLGKNPEDYPDAKSLPHVQVAMKMKAKGQSAKAGDVIPYIFCIPPNGEKTKSAQAANAHHPDDVRRSGSTLKIDLELYISTQVLPPIERLCEHIEGTEKARLAECLGLDAVNYKSSFDAPEREFKTLQSQISDAQRFADAVPFNVRCRACGSSTAFEPLGAKSSGVISKSGMFCGNLDCQQPLSIPSLAIQLDLQIRSFISKFYEAWLVCDESTCSNRTRMMSVYGKRCLQPQCRGAMHFEYSDAKLYDQLLYFDMLFDVEKARAKVAGGLDQPEFTARAEANKVALDYLRKVVTKHLEKNGRRWVSMESLFSFMKV